MKFNGSAIMTKRGSSIKTFRTKVNRCLACRYRIDSASTTMGGRQPKPGDVSVCLMCGHLMGFNADMTVRELTSDEMYQIAGDKRIWQIQKARSHVLLNRTKP